MSPVSIDYRLSVDTEDACGRMAVSKLDGSVVIIELVQFLDEPCAMHLDLTFHMRDTLLDQVFLVRS